MTLFVLRWLISYCCFLVDNVFQICRLTCCLCGGVLQPVAEVLPADFLLLEDSGSRRISPAHLCVVAGCFEMFAGCSWLIAKWLLAGCSSPCPIFRFTTLLVLITVKSSLVFGVGYTDSVSHDGFWFWTGVSQVGMLLWLDSDYFPAVCFKSLL